MEVELEKLVNSCRLQVGLAVAFASRIRVLFVATRCITDYIKIWTHGSSKTGINTCRLHSLHNRSFSISVYLAEKGL